METPISFALLFASLVFALSAVDTNTTSSNRVTNQAGVVGSSNTTHKVTTVYSYHAYTTVEGADNIGNSLYTTGKSPASKNASESSDVDEELFSYSVTPSSLDVKIGESFALTCKVDSSKGLKELSWMMKANSESPQRLNCDRKNEEGLSCEIREYPNTLFSVLNITLYDSSVNYTFYCTRNSLLQTNRQLVLPLRGAAVVKVHSANHNLEIGLEVTGASFVVLVVLAVAVFVFRKQNVRSRIIRNPVPDV